MDDKILEVKNLHVSFDTYAGEVKAIRDLSFEVLIFISFSTRFSSLYNNFSGYNFISVNYPA